MNFQLHTQRERRKLVEISWFPRFCRQLLAFTSVWKWKSDKIPQCWDLGEHRDVICTSPWVSMPSSSFLNVTVHFLLTPGDLCRACSQKNLLLSCLLVSSTLAFCWGSLFVCSFLNVGLQNEHLLKMKENSVFMCRKFGVAVTEHFLCEFGCHGVLSSCLEPKSIWPLIQFI